MKKICDYCGARQRLKWHEILSVHCCPRCVPEMEKDLEFERKYGRLRSLAPLKKKYLRK